MKKFRVTTVLVYTRMARKEKLRISPAAKTQYPAISAFLCGCAKSTTYPDGAGTAATSVAEAEAIPTVVCKRVQRVCNS